MPSATSLHPSIARTTQLAVSFNGNGDNTLVALVTAKPIYLWKIWLLAASTVNAKFLDGAGGAALSGLFPLPTVDPFILPYDSEPWFVTTAGNALVLNLSSGVQVSGMIYYTTAAKS